MYKLIFRMLIALPFYALARSSLAADEVIDLGHVAQHLMEPVGIVSDFVHTGCILFGIGFLFAAIVKYVEHRRSPLMVPISTVVFLIIAGIFLLLLPLVPYLTENGVSYSILK